MHYQEWIMLGERLGLAGRELALFIKEKEDEFLAREERLLRREEEKRRVEREFELQMKEHEMELERLRISRQDDNSCRTPRPKLPKFDEARDDIDAFIERFERFAKSQNWEETSWAISLSSLLSGKGLEVYTSMPPDQAGNYVELKRALLKRYQLTEEGFRTKFRQSKPESGESVFQFVARLRRYFNRWTQMAEVSDNMDSLTDLIIREQFVQSCSTELALFLRERAPKSVEEVTRLSEQYLEAHNKKSTGSKNPSIVQPKLNKGNEIDERRMMREKTSMSNRKTCFVCNKAGHIARECRYRNSNGPTQEQKKSERKIAAVCVSTEIPEGPIKENTNDGKLDLANGDSVPVVSGGCTIDGLDGERNLDLRRGFIGTRAVQVLRDTGCELAAVRRDLVGDDQMLDKQICMVTIDGDAKMVPVAKIDIDTPYYTGKIEAMAPKSLICDLIIGNIPGVLDKPAMNWKSKHDYTSVAAVSTRAQTRKAEQNLQALKVPIPSCSQEMNVDMLKKAQKEDDSLARLWDLAKQENIKETKGGATYSYQVKQGVLYRVYKQKRGSQENELKQVLVPTSFRKRVMELAHESIVGGHLSVKKTDDRIMSSFYWPGVSSDVSRFCRSCDICQRTLPKGRVKRVPLGEMPVMEEPFQRVAIDLIGPISPISYGGNRYILTVVDYATRYPEAVALPRIETERVAEALLDVFSRVGFPSEVLSDRGSQFTSDMMREVCRLISVKQLFTTPYNPRCNGLCERINGVLKNMLKKMCQERPTDWDRYISAVLFAYREVPQTSTGFSPFELLYGRTVRGPMQILKELWTGEEASETMNTYQYVLELKQRLEETCKIARESLSKAHGVYKHHYDKKTRRRYLKIGDKVLILLPTDRNKMLLQWKGPYEVTGVNNKVDYRVKVGDRISTYHINLLKKYEERSGLLAATVAVLDDEEDQEYGAVDDGDLLELPRKSSRETYRDVKICERLAPDQKKQVLDLLQEFSDIFSEKPGTTSVVEHRVELTEQKPIRVKQYPMPYAKRQDVDIEVQEMLKAGVIEPATSEYNSPVVMVKKKDGSNRFCVDFRRLNAVTKFDTEPMANVDDILAKLKHDKIFTKIDLSKGYWQIPVSEECRHLTAFSTDKQTYMYQFRKMPFGMVNSGATFNRMMRIMLKGCRNVDNYVDDILGHTVVWEDHMDMLRDVFTRIRKASLTVRPSKCMIGFSNIGFTGHMVGNGVVQMEEEKIERIKQAEVPKSKRQVRAFLGLASYYRKFIPSFAETAAPLTDLTKKGQPNLVRWGEMQDKAFNKLKKQLTQAPILRLPDFTKMFILQCDASNTGVGAALLQQHEDGLFPIAFASKKLLQREKNYSVTERECLAIIFGIKRFQKYLYGKEFVIQTDHCALSHIQKSAPDNGRLMRWALFLQTYKFRIEAIKGSENIFADYLSRQSTTEGPTEENPVDEKA